MKGAIMQPYLFPYIGYYQLAYEAERFIFFDDVNFIKKGYVNRNSILLNGAPYVFSIPVVSVSQNKKINEHFYVGNFSKFIRLIKAAYKQAIFFNDVLPVIEEVLLGGGLNVAKKNAASIKTVFNYLEISKKYSFSSKEQCESPHKGQQRIIDLCKSIGINQYINAIGGQDIYAYQAFKEADIDLKFIKTETWAYQQNTKTFVPNLSMIDILMWNDKKTVREIIKRYSLV